MLPRILIVDNFDSFTFNLYHYVQQCNIAQVEVVRNNLNLCEIAKNFDAIILSPGPGLPENAGNMSEFIESFAQKMPILGVCLGHQALALHFGAKLINMREVMHGRESELFEIDFEDVIFKGLEKPIIVGRYHSWAVSKQELPELLKVTSVDINGLIMSFTHAILPISGVQFHPESIMSNNGLQMVRNWVNSL